MPSLQYFAAVRSADVRLKAFEALDQEIDSMGNHVKTIRAVVTENVSEISEISGQMTAIGEGAQKAAAASEEVTASVF